MVAYDPKGMHKARSIKAIADAEFASSALEAVTDAEALIIATDWNEFANVDLAVLKDKMRTPIVFDGRNLLDPETMRQFGFQLLLCWTRRREAAVTNTWRGVLLAKLRSRPCGFGERKSASRIPLSQGSLPTRISLRPIVRLPWNCSMAFCAI